MCDLLPLFTTMIQNSAKTCHNSQTIAMCLAPSFIGRYASRKDSLAVAIKYTRNLIDHWPQIDDRLAEYIDSDDSEDGYSAFRSGDSNKVARMKSFDTPSAFRALSRHNIRAVNSHQDVSNSVDAFPGVSKTQVRSFSSAASGRVHDDCPPPPLPRSIHTSRSMTSDSSGEHSVDSKSSRDYLTSSSTTTSMGPPPPPPPKLRKSASTILRPTISTSSLTVASASAPSLPSPTKDHYTHVPQQHKLKTRSSYSGDLNQNFKHGDASATAPGSGAKVFHATTTKRGRMVAELTKLYEEKTSSMAAPHRRPMVLLEMDKSKSNILS